MKQFLKLVAANVLALAIFCGVGFFGLIFLLVSASLGSKQPLVSIKSGSVLVLDLTANISDAPPESALDRALGKIVGRPSAPNYYLLELTDAIDRAARDKRISAIYLHGSLISENYGSGVAALAEVRRAMSRFREAGKPVYAYSVSPTQKDYYLMSVADEVVMNPFGDLALVGLAAKSPFIADALERMGVGIQVTKAGKYKSALDMFTRESISQADREQLTALLGGIWLSMIGEIASSRGLEVATVQNLSAEEGLLLPDAALDAKLIDRVAYLDEVIELLGNEFGWDADEETFRQVAMRDYISAVGWENSAFDSENAIAIVYAEGDIIDGFSRPGSVGGDEFAEMIRSLRKDPAVKAMVLRVNSPGGSALASEIIQREIRLAGEQMPVVVSMGGMAASGGYWISAYSDAIVAEPTTITGSIGVFGLIYNVEALANRYGVYFDGVQTGPFADLATVTRPKTEREMALIQDFTDRIYLSFLTKVAEGRGMDLAAVDAVAQGRVWTGADALRVGLVDELGGLGKAIDRAVELAGVGADWHLEQYPYSPSLEEELEEILDPNRGTPPVAQIPSQGSGYSQLISLFKQQFQLLNSLNDPKGTYARLPWLIQP